MEIGFRFLYQKNKRHFPIAEVVSLGGATEASIWSIYYPVKQVKSHWNSIPYGMPLANQTYYVLNYEKKMCPVGVIGDLYIGGVGLAKGYLNAEKKQMKRLCHILILVLYTKPEIVEKCILRDILNF